MTVPTPAAEPSPPSPPSAPAHPVSVQTLEDDAEPVRFPLTWLLDHATPGICYRALADVAGMDAAQHPGMDSLPYASPTAIRIAVSQAVDGTWNRSMLSFPAGKAAPVAGLGTIPAVYRLLEYGWHRDSPALAHARRVLFRLLAEDNDPEYLFELRNSAKNEEAALRARALLREAAAAVLARAGYESDPRLRGAARRVLERIAAFLASPLAEKPWIRVGNRHVLAQEATPPSIYSLTMLAHMPIFRSEHYPEMEALLAYLSAPQPRQEVVQQFGSVIVQQPQLVLGDMLGNRNVLDADVPFALLWLETMARLNFLPRNDNWIRLFERLVDDRGRDSVWHPHKGSVAPTSASPYVWSTFPLEDGTGPDAAWTDVTFRIGLIAKLAGRRTELV